MLTVSEAGYPISFREKEALLLGEYICYRQTVEIVGMRRVGINNFLRFFLYHRSIIPTYVHDGKKHLFVPVDLFDLVECNIYSFWHLVLKRIADQVESGKFSKKTKRIIDHLFLTSIQTKDLFLTIDVVKKVLRLIIKEEYLPTLFIIRFDRLKSVITADFFANLQGLIDATNHKVMYIFTSYRTLYELAPTVFTKPSLSSFCQTMYLRPANDKDSLTILKTNEEKFHLHLDQSFKKKLIEQTSGHAHYLRLALIIISELQKHHHLNQHQFLDRLISDERIILQSEEIYNGLDQEEKDILRKTCKSKFNQKELINYSYLIQTGTIDIKGKLFNQLFDNYLCHINGIVSKQSQSDLTKKEQMMFNLLLENSGKLCDRLLIQDKVWPEYEEIGISDWAIDRLVSRLRHKLQLQNQPYRIVTIRTKGFTLILKLQTNLIDSEKRIIFVGRNNR